MKNVRRLIYLLSSLIGLWVLGSFVGAMVNSANADFWTTSLIWALLCCLLVMPALVMINHASSPSAEETSSTEEQDSSVEKAAPKQEPFVKGSGSDRTLWPQSEEKEWPPSQESNT